MEVESLPTRYIPAFRAHRPHILALARHPTETSPLPLRALRRRAPRTAPVPGRMIPTLGQRPDPVTRLLLKRIPVALDPTARMVTITTFYSTSRITPIPGRQPHPQPILPRLHLVRPLPHPHTLPVSGHRPAILHGRLAIKLLTILQCNRVKMPRTDQTRLVVNLLNVAQRQWTASWHEYNVQRGGWLEWATTWSTRLNTYASMNTYRGNRWNRCSRGGDHLVRRRAVSPRRICRQRRRGSGLSSEHCHRQWMMRESLPIRRPQRRKRGGVYAWRRGDAKGVSYSPCHRVYGPMNPRGAFLSSVEV